jgi:hypothetical protein
MLDLLEFTFYSYFVRTQWGSKRCPPGHPAELSDRASRTRMNFPKTGSGDMSPHIRLVEIGSPLSRASD